MAKELCFYKILHRPTGLYYIPNTGYGNNTNNLSKVGKVYQRKPSLKQIYKFIYYKGKPIGSSSDLEIVKFPVNTINNENKNINQDNTKIDKVNKYRKKPIVIEAIQFTFENYKDVCDFVGQYLEPIDRQNEYTEIIIPTLEDGSKNQVKHVAKIGDYIIKGVDGEFYPCKPDIFNKTYEKV